VRCLYLSLTCLLLVGLWGCGQEHDPQFYADRLGHRKQAVRERAIQELKRLQEDALDVIEKKLGSEDPEVRKACLEVLGAVRRTRSLTLAGGLIDDPDKDVRLVAIQTVSGLSQVCKKDSAELLGAGLQGRDEECIKAAAEGLSAMTYKEATDVLRDSYEKGEGVHAIYAARYLYDVEPTIDIPRFLLESTLSDDEQVRSAARLCVGELSDRIIEPLVRFADEHKENASAGQLLTEVRDSLIAELNKTLDTKRAAVICEALGTVADDKCVEELKADMYSRNLESSWRVAAADGLTDAARSKRASPALRVKVITILSDALQDKGMDNRVQIGASIGLCRLERRSGVDFLLTALSEFQKTINDQSQKGAARQESLTQLRIRAQEALTASGEFVVDALRRAATKKDADPYIIWAAAKTFGELGVQDTTPFLGRLITEQTTPEVTLLEDGRLSKREDVQVADPNVPDEVEVANLEKKLEIFAYPDFVRWSAAIALGQIGGEQSVRLLQKGMEAEQDFLRRLRSNKELDMFHDRAPVIDSLIHRHDDVLFYIRRALQQAEGAAQTGS